ncbi:MAG: tetratricopeptide repeat protein [Planctomycetota bacterium]
MDEQRPAGSRLGAESRTWQGPPAGQPRSRATAAAGILLVGMTVVAHLPATQCAYIWDDDAYVQDNSALRSSDGLSAIWFHVGASPQYYPMVFTSYWIEYRLWGQDPAGYHVVNIVLHALAAVLLWRVLAVLQLPGAWAAAAVFALHPVHVESVAWITERKNVLSGVFYFGAALAYLRYALGSGDGAGRYRAVGLYALSLVLFLCALLSKTVTCTLPAALLLVWWWKQRRMSWQKVGALAPFFALGIAFGLLTVWVEKRHVGAEGEEWTLSIVERCLVAGRALCFYAGKLLWPADLTFIYPRWRVDAHAWQQYVYPVSAISVMAALWLARCRIGRAPLAAVLCFAGALFPALGFFDVYFFRYSFVADHFQYLASAGLIALVAALGYGAAARLGKHAQAIRAITLAPILVTLGALTWRQAHVYRDREALWRDTLLKNPNCWLAHNNLGVALEADDKPHEAISHYHHALEATPGFVSNLARTHQNLGGVLRSQGRLDEALAQWREMLKLDPDYSKAHFNIGIILQAQNRLNDAIAHFRRAVRGQPHSVLARCKLGDALCAQGEYEEAIGQYRQAQRFRPDFPPAHYSLGNALIMMGQIDAGLAHLREVARLSPHRPAPLNDMAWILATHPDAKVRDERQALELAQRAAELAKYRDPAILDTLAAAYAAAGQFDRAVAVAERGLESASAARLENLASALRQRLALYRQKKPYRQPARPQGAPHRGL